MRPSWTTTLSRSSRACVSPDRLILPSTTMQPAAAPNFGTLNTSRTCACPTWISLTVGSRRPAIAFLISSVTS